MRPPRSPAPPWSRPATCLTCWPAPPDPAGPARPVRHARPAPRLRQRHLDRTAGRRDERGTALTRLFDYYLACRRRRRWTSWSRRNGTAGPASARRPRPSRRWPARPRHAPGWMPNGPPCRRSPRTPPPAAGPATPSACRPSCCRYVETGGHYTDASPSIPRPPGRPPGRRPRRRGLRAEPPRLHRGGWAATRRPPRYLRQALALFRETGDRSGAARALTNLASRRVAAGPLPAGRRAPAGRRWPLFREIGDQSARPGR